MRRLLSFTPLVLPAAVLALTISTAWAQPGPPDRDGPRGPLSRLLANEDALNELGINEEQRSQLRELAESLRAEMREQFEAVKDLSPEERRERRAEFREGRQERRQQVRDRLAEILEPEQLEKLRDMRARWGGPRSEQDARRRPRPDRGDWGGPRADRDKRRGPGDRPQRYGRRPGCPVGPGGRGPGGLRPDWGRRPGGPDGPPRMNFDPKQIFDRIAKRLELTDEQRERIKEIHKETREKMRDIHAETRERVKEVHQQSKDKMRDVLNEEQLETWERIRERMEQAMRRGGPGGGPPKFDGPPRRGGPPKGAFGRPGGRHGAWGRGPRPQDGPPPGETPKP